MKAAFPAAVRVFPGLRAALLAGVFCCAAGAGWAQPASAPETATPARDVRTWLLRIHEAASQRNFQGTFIVSGNGSMSSSRIAHYCDGKEQVERIESLDGEKRVVLRHNDRVHTVWPDSRVVQVEQRASIQSFPALLQAGADGIADFYDVVSQGSERVAGHEATVLLVKPRDAHRYGYRLWSEKASGLLLRVDVLGDGGAVVETSAFSDVTIGVRPQGDAVLQAMKKLDGQRVLRPALVATALDAEGWSLQPVAGFRMVSCVKRPLDADERDTGAQVLQTIFSDGLTHVSVFIEPFNPRRHVRAMATSVGATQTLMRRHGDSWVTVVGDVPPATLRLFATGLEPRK
jgi:sigma-E factor negative regulatory protein RseB